MNDSAIYYLTRDVDMQQMQISALQLQTKQLKKQNTLLGIGLGLTIVASIATLIEVAMFEDKVEQKEQEAEKYAFGL